MEFSELAKWIRKEEGGMMPIVRRGKERSAGPEDAIIFMVRTLICLYHMY